MKGVSLMALAHGQHKGYEVTPFQKAQGCEPVLERQPLCTLV